jgi:cytochrome c oxidase cbb3-type subunit 3
MKATPREINMAEKEEYEKVKDTGHNWDGITELDNPPPRWWLNALYLSGLFVLVYLILYPSLPLVHDSTKGLLGWTQIGEYKEALAVMEERRAPYEEKFSQMTIEEVLVDADMLNYISASSKVLFGDNCAACHGVGGQPPQGAAYPVLADDDWLYGGTIDEIMMSIAKGRIGLMPAHAGALTKQEVNLLTQFVIDSSNGVKNEAGRALYDEFGCAMCHGDDAKGDKYAGSANLTDRVWRFSGEEEQVRRTILHGVNDSFDPQTRLAMMPQWSEKMALMLEIKADVLNGGEKVEDINWEDELSGDETERLSESDIKKLAIYVHQLGGGE